MPFSHPRRLADPSEIGDPVLALLLARARDGAGRRDPHVLCLAVEGGGMRGGVAAGMCTVLEEAGLMACFDRVYGCSAGALTGTFAAAGLATRWAMSFHHLATRHFIDPLRALRGRPVIDLRWLFEEMLPRRVPLRASALRSGPELRAIAVSARNPALRVLQDFSGVDEQLRAVRASCSIPVFGGPPTVFRDEELWDGGLLEPMPFRSALAEGATHVLVLRTRPAAFRARPPARPSALALRQMDSRLLALAASATEVYNEDADELERLVAAGAAVSQVTVPAGADIADQLSIDARRIAASIELGALAMLSRVGPERRPVAAQLAVRVRRPRLAAALGAG
jgi:predicted acylesterase/phospholipase RssA